jgi:Tfp pilus assembly protein PilF
VWNWLLTWEPCNAWALALDWPRHRSACSKDPDQVKRDHILRGDAFVAQKKYAEASIEYRSAIQADARDVEARKKLAEVYVVTQDLTEALREYVRAADLAPDDIQIQLAAGGFMQLAGRSEANARRCMS